ncbi:MAG: hypothetical protein KatS3mg104_2970 [Phycisphaerae bacterium]|nr:MAG: hypothetical protein KatS3mg104_2970 [Phycisphaerae bacterium]
MKTVFIIAPFLIATLPVRAQECVERTGSSMVLVIPSDLTSDVVDGEETLLAFNSENLCVGRRQLTAGKSEAVTLWGDNLITPEKDGLSEGEKPYFVLGGDILHVFSEGQEVTYRTRSIAVADSLFRDTGLPVVVGDIDLWISENTGIVRVKFPFLADEVWIEKKMAGGGVVSETIAARTRSVVYNIDVNVVESLRVGYVYNGLTLYTPWHEITPSGVHVFPNPTFDYITVRTPSPRKVRIVNVIGERVYEGAIDGEERILLPRGAGVYIIELLDDKGAATRRTVVKF